MMEQTVLLASHWPLTEKGSFFSTGASRKVPQIKINFTDSIF